MLVRLLFTFGLSGLHVARVLSTFGLVAVHLARVLFTCGLGQGVVYFLFGLRTFG